MAKIGIFWVSRDTVFGKAVSIDMGTEGVPGIIDSPDTHVDVWEHERPWIHVSATLADVEYQDIPRGRVLFQLKQEKPLVYADKTLMNAANKLLISQFFDFNPSVALWRSDVHYTTSKNELDQLFSDEFD